MAGLHLLLELQGMEFCKPSTGPSLEGGGGWIRSTEHVLEGIR
jgi:hypothetical protein